MARVGRRLTWLLALFTAITFSSCGILVSTTTPANAATTPSSNAYVDSHNLSTATALERTTYKGDLSPLRGRDQTSKVRFRVFESDGILVVAAEAETSSTTILGENMAGRVQPFADATGSRTLGFGSSEEEWNAMSPAQRWRLNDGQLRARINEGDDFRYIGQDPDRSPLLRQQFDLTRSELLRLGDRGIPFDFVSPDEVFKMIGRF